MAFVGQNSSFYTVRGLISRPHSSIMNPAFQNQTYFESQDRKQKFKKKNLLDPENKNEKPFEIKKEDLMSLENKFPRKSSSLPITIETKIKFGHSKNIQDSTVARRFSLTKIRLEDMNIEKFDPKNIKIMNSLDSQNKINQKKKTISFFSMTCAFINILLVIIDNEFRWQKIDNLKIERVVLIIIRSISMILCIIQSILIIIESKYLAQLSRIKKIYPENSSIFNLNEFPIILIEIVIALIHIPPFLEIFDRSDSLDYCCLILTSACFIKMYLIFKVLEAISPVNSQKGKFIGSLRGIGFSKSFIFKSWVNKNEFAWLMIELIVFVLICAYLAYIFDRSGRYLDVNYLYYEYGYPFNYFDYVWMLLIAFTTVGLGDYLPLNHESRLCCILGGIGGILFIASLIGIIHSNLSLSEEESKVYEFLQFKESEKQFLNKAAVMITECFKLNLIRKRQR